MSIYQVDRVQYIESEDTIIIFEFFLVDNINEFVKNFKKEGEKLKQSYIEKEYYGKLITLWNLSIHKKTELLIIVYDSKFDEILYIQRDKEEKKYSWKFINIEQFQEKFIKINNKNGEIKKSKKLGSIRNENRDAFTLDTLEKIGSYVDENDDNGLELTKQLLDNNTTKGFDFDLFQYIESTDETIIYEFLKNKSTYVSNYTANPMRYCWKKKGLDNKQKFISLWTAKQKLDGRLFLINYSDNKKDGIGISEITDLDAKKGLRQEIKYNLTYDEYIEWMTDMNNYNSTDSNYMKKYEAKSKHYDEDFFDNWDVKKREYR